jgi:hypothetical protein
VIVGGRGDGGGGGGNKMPRWDNWEAHLTLALLTALGLTLSSSSLADHEKEITFQEFRKRLLEKGLVDRIGIKPLLSSHPPHPFS